MSRKLEHYCLLILNYLCIYSLSRHLLRAYHVPDLVLCPGLTKVNKTVEAPASWSLYSSGEDRRED